MKIKKTPVHEDEKTPVHEDGTKARDNCSFPNQGEPGHQKC